MKEQAEQYHQALLSEKGRKAFDYLTDRGLTQDTIKEWQLGYANSSDKEFAGRVIFPIYNHKKEIVGFTGRSLEEGVRDEKYKHSKGYKKTEVLYGFDRAKPYIQSTNQVVLVEGHLDVILAHQAGYKNVVALCGTDFSQEQLNLISKNKTIVFCLDRDEAGQKATKRHRDWLIESERKTKYLILPIGSKDIADAVVSGDTEFINKPVEYIEYFKDKWTDKDFSILQNKKDIIEELLPVLMEMSRGDAEDQIEAIARITDIDKEAIQEEVDKQHQKKGTEEMFSPHEFLIKIFLNEKHRDNKKRLTVVTNLMGIQDGAKTALYWYSKIDKTYKKITDPRLLYRECKDAFVRWNLKNKVFKDTKGHVIKKLSRDEFDVGHLQVVENHFQEGLYYDPVQPLRDYLKKEGDRLVGQSSNEIIDKKVTDLLRRLCRVAMFEDWDDPTTRQDYVEFLRSWMTAYMCRTHMPGTKYILFLLLQGRTGENKSDFFEAMAPRPKSKFYYATTPNITPREMITHLSNGVGIVEIKEFSLMYMNNESFKRMIDGNPEDTLKHGNTPIKLNLTNIFGASTEQEEPIYDESGTFRRAMIIKIKNIGEERDVEKIEDIANTIYKYLYIKVEREIKKIKEEYAGIEDEEIRDDHINSRVQRIPYLETDTYKRLKESGGGVKTSALAEEFTPIFMDEDGYIQGYTTLGEFKEAVEIKKNNNNIKDNAIRKIFSGFGGRKVGYSVKITDKNGNTRSKRIMLFGGATVDNPGIDLVERGYDIGIFHNRDGTYKDPKNPTPEEELNNSLNVLDADTYDKQCPKCKTTVAQLALSGVCGLCESKLKQ